MIGSRFGRTRQLRQRNDRDVQLLRESFERSRDRRKLDLPALEAPASLHQLDVVDDQQMQAVLRLQSPRLARISSTPSDAVSSMYTRASASVPSACDRRP